MKKAVALIIYKNKKQNQILSVLRPEDDENHPGMWGLPATSLKTQEDWEDAVHRAADQKLGIKVEIKQKLSQGTQKRENYKIKLRNYEVEIIEGEPDVDQENVESTKYEDWKWLKIEKLKKTAEEGASLCTSLLLEQKNHEFQPPSNIIDKKYFHKN